VQAAEDAWNPDQPGRPAHPSWHTAAPPVRMRASQAAAYEVKLHSTALSGCCRWTSQRARRQSGCP
jgi:hypothetical protein